MTDKRKFQIEAEVTADTSGLDQIAQAAQGMAEAVQEAGQQAAQGLNAVTAGAAPAAEGLDAAQRRMQASIQRTVATMKAGAAGSADYYEALARSRNIDTAPLDAYIGELRRVEQAQRAAKQATAEASKADAFIASLRQQADAVGRTRSEVLALQAAELGLSGQASQYIQRLRQMEQGQNAVGTSAKQTAFAMRTIPAQLQDIAVSLQGGQNPLTVLTQQGSQIATVFGGVGPAIRGVGAYVLGLVNPFTVAAAAAVGLTVALVQGAREQEAIQRALITTGNVAGKTASQVADMARALGSGDFTQSEASAALAEMVRSSGVAGDQLQHLTAVTLEWERATGQAVSKTAAQFKELGEAPLAASVKLNAEIHHLTAALYEQIKALDEQGRHQDAARVATDAFADTLERRSKQIIANNGFLVTSWEAVSLAVRKAANAVLDFGRDATGSEQLASLRKQLSIREERGPMRPQDPASVTAFEKGNKDLRDRIALIETLNQRQAAGSQEQAKQNQQLQTKIDWDKQGVQFLTKQQQLQRELTKAETEGQALVKAGLISEEQLRTRLAGIRDKFKENRTSGAAGTGQNEVAGIQARVREQQQYLQALQQQLSAGAFGDDAKLTEGQKKVIEIQEQLKTSISGVARAEKERALVAAQSLVAIDRQVIAQERQNKAYQDAVATVSKQADAASQQADAIRQQAEGQEAANATFGKSKTAIEEMVLAQLRLQAAEAESSDTFDPRYVAGLNAKVEAQNRYVVALQEAANKQAALGNANLAEANQRDSDLLQLELSLAGQTQEVRQRIVEQRRIELDYAKRIADVDKLGLTPADTAARKAELATQQVIAVSNAGAKATLDQWNRTTDSINQSLTDALLRGFESGKDFAENLRDTVKNLFATLVLRPVIQAVMSPVSGMLTGIGQQIGGAIFGGAGGGGGAGSLLGAAGTAGSLAGGLGSLGAAFGAGSSSVGVMAGSLAGSGGLLGGTASAMAAIGPVGWAALAATAAYSIFSKQGGGPKTEAGAGIGVRTTGDIGGVATSIHAIQQQYAAIIASLGGRAGHLDLGIFSAQDPQGTALSQLAFNASLNGQNIYSREARLGGIENVGRGEQDLQNAVAAETQRVVLTALANSNLVGNIGDYLKQLGDINALSDGAVEASLTRAQAIATQQAQIESQIFELTSTDAEKLARQRDEETRAVDDANRSLLDRLHALQDEKRAADEATASLARQSQIQAQIFDLTATDAEKLAKQRADERGAADAASQSLLDRLYALQDEKKATDEAAAAIENARASAAQFSDFLKGINTGIGGFIDSLNASPQGLLPPEVQVSNSKNQFDRQLALARAGDREALGSITDYANQVIELQTAFTASGAETAKVIGDVKAMLFGLTLGPIATPGADVAQPPPALFTQPAPLPTAQQATPVSTTDAGLIQEVVNLRGEVERLTAVVASYASRDLEHGQALVDAVTSTSNAALLDRVA